MTLKEVVEQPGISCSCWEASIEPEAVDAFLLETRRKNPRAIIQVIGVGKSPNARMLEMVAAQTLMGVRLGASLAEKPELDLLLRLAGTRQIGEAFKKIGYKGKGRKLFLVAASELEDGTSRLRAELEKDSRFTAVKRKELGPGDLEKVEKAALLAVRL